MCKKHIVVAGQAKGSQARSKKWKGRSKLYPEKLRS